MIWDHTKWGTVNDPIHKSDLNNIIGKFGCTEQFRRKKNERALGTISTGDNSKVSGKACMGNAVHAVIARILRSPPACAAALHPDYSFPEGTIRKSIAEEFNLARAGREVQWYKTNGEKWTEEQTASLMGMLQDLHNHVGEVVLAEAGFVYQLNGIWLTGMTDLVYKAPGSDRISWADWKGGAQKPHQIELDHGWESGIYSGAVQRAWFIPGESIEPLPGEEHRDAMERACIQLANMWQASERDAGQGTIPGLVNPTQVLNALVMQHNAVRFDEFPERIRLVHMRDYIPYSRATTKELKRPEELAWAGLKRPEKVKFSKGDQRGPGWLHIQRAESDMPRLTHLLDSVVSWIRHGKFAATPGELCSRCKFRDPCLNDGYQPIGEELVQLATATEGLDVDGFDGLDSL